MITRTVPVDPALRERGAVHGPGILGCRSTQPMTRWRRLMGVPYESADQSATTQGVAAKESSPERAALVGFRDLASALAAEHDLDAVFHMVVDTLVELTSADRCSLHL